MFIMQSGAAPCGPFHPKGPCFLCVAVITAYMKLFGKIFAVQHSSYAVSKFELGRPSERRENGWEHVCDEQHEYEKRQRKF